MAICIEHTCERELFEDTSSTRSGNNVQPSVDLPSMKVRFLSHLKTYLRHRCVNFVAPTDRSARNRPIRPAKAVV